MLFRSEEKDIVLDPSLQMKTKETKALAETILTKGESKMDELVEMLVEKGVKNTLDVVNEMDNPHLSDDFHRFLIQYLSGGMTVRGVKEGSTLFKADRKSTRLNSSHIPLSRMPSSA